MLEADQGSVLVDAGGRIDASGAQGGSVTLAAANDVIVNGAIDAHATLAGERGGTVTLESGDASGSSGTGQILVNAGSTHQRERRGSERGRRGRARAAASC